MCDWMLAMHCNGSWCLICLWNLFILQTISFFYCWDTSSMYYIQVYLARGKEVVTVKYFYCFSCIYGHSGQSLHLSYGFNHPDHWQDTSCIKVYTTNVSDSDFMLLFQFLDNTGNNQGIGSSQHRNCSQHKQSEI